MRAPGRFPADHAFLDFMRTPTILALSTAISGLAFGQVTYGTDDSGEQENFALDTGSGTSTGPEWTGAEAWGIGDDDVNSLFYVNNGSTLYSHPFGMSGGAATNIGTILFNGAASSMTGLAYDNGVLYGHRNIATEALYTIDVVTLDATIAYTYSTTTIDLGGLDADPATGLILGSNDSSAYTDPNGNGGTGVVTLDVVAQTESLDFPYPAGETDIDGLAFDPNGTGTIWYIEDEPAPLHNYDIGSMTFDPAPPMNAVQGSRIFSAGTYDGDGGGGGLGTNYCGPGVPNSTGNSGTISATGSDSVAANNVTLTGSDLPNNATAFFLTSMTQDFVMNPGGSDGNLCLGGAIGRYVGPGQIQNSGAMGEVSLVLDLTMVPQPTGFVSVMPGDTWNFTCWFRDANPGPTSNFTDGLSIVFI